MIHAPVIIVGGGPAGSSCAWRLAEHRVPALVLDRQDFPRLKLCAGWITPGALRDLEVRKGEYPYGMLAFQRLVFHAYGRTFRVPTLQYSVRRVELDAWLLQRSGAAFLRHEVKSIRKENGRFILDEAFSCRFLVGAGGTNCRVFRTFFRDARPRDESRLIVALEQELACGLRDADCHLWFFDNGLPGYAWYVPKADGWVNVGVGGKAAAMKERGAGIKEHWDRLAEKLHALGLVSRTDFSPRGCTYYLRQASETGRAGNAFVVGDAAGLATLDMGEGIAAAVRSGILAADAIACGRPYRPRSVKALSLPGIAAEGLLRLRTSKP
ncbi:MAG: NAD(P)/FAD-dependent oxidoreductase [Thermodesulfobacteriota bacterium]